MLALVQQQRGLVRGLEDGVVALRQQRRAAAELQRGEALRTVAQCGEHLHAAQRQRHERRAGAIVHLQAGAEFVDHACPESRREHE